MKRTFIFLVLAIMAICVNSQNKFEPQIKIGYDFGIDEDKNNSLGAEFLAGYRIKNNLRIGIGTGISWCKHLYEKAGVNHYLNKYYSDYRETAAYVPIFANVKYKFTTIGISPYIAMDLGYSLFISFSDYAKDNKLGIMAKPAFGLDFPLSKGKLFIEVGYKYQQRSWDLLDTPSYSQATTSIGYQF